MHILFLQKVDNARGGIANVNLNLMSYFLSQGDEISVVSIRHGYTFENIPYPSLTKRYVINEKTIWGMPRLREIADLLRKGHILKAFRLGLERVRYQKEIREDYACCQNLIRQISPDVIINSHYEVLSGVPDEYLKRTVMHFHTSFDQVLENNSYQKTFDRYKDRIFCFIWLSQATMKQAVDHGYSNSRYIYNPISFSTDAKSELMQKKVVFIGRLAEEKRVHLAIEYFEKVVSKHHLDDWKLEIYGNGDEAEHIQKIVQDKKNISYMGQTNEVEKVLLDSSLMILTSRFEGMPLVVLEANECGVPVVSYDFGETSKEVILDGQTGLLIAQDDADKFCQALLKVMEDDAFRLALGRQAKTFSKAFSLNEIGRQWQSLCIEIKQSI